MTSRTKVVDERRVAHLHVESGVDCIGNKEKDDLKE